LQQGLHEKGSAGFAAFFLGAIESAEFDCRSSARFGGVGAGGDEFFDSLLEVKTQLGIELGFELASAEELRQPARRLLLFPP
jgi:hypothetical protein